MSDEALDIPAGQLPPATLSFLANTLAMQALVALGEIPNPLTGTSEPRLDQARHFIDALNMLLEKTKGNRTPEESSVLRNWISQLQMLFISR